MTLHEFLQTTNQKPSDFAAKLGVPPSTVSRWVRGDRFPTLRMAMLIREKTDGSVTIDDFFTPASSRPSEVAA